MEQLTKEIFLDMTERCPVIPAIKNDQWLSACNESESEIVYLIYGNICNIMEHIDTLKSMGKYGVVHVDLIEGLAVKEISVDFIKKYTKADGRISTKPGLIKRANELGMFTVQRFFMTDALSYANIVKYVHNTNPDVVELLPAGLPKVIRYLLEEIQRPVVASGLLLDKKDVITALGAGVHAVSTTNRELWDC